MRARAARQRQLGKNYYLRLPIVGGRAVDSVQRELDVRAPAEDRAPAIDRHLLDWPVRADAPHLRREARADQVQLRRLRCFAAQRERRRNTEHVARDRGVERERLGCRLLPDVRKRQRLAGTDRRHDSDAVGLNDVGELVGLVLEPASLAVGRDMTGGHPDKHPRGLTRTREVLEDERCLLRKGSRHEKDEGENVAHGQICCACWRIW